MSEKNNNPLQISFSIFLVLVLVADILTISYKNEQEYNRGFDDARFEDISIILETQQSLADSLSADSVESFIDHSKIPNNVK